MAEWRPLLGEAQGSGGEDAGNERAKKTGGSGKIAAFVQVLQGNLTFGKNADDPPRTCARPEVARAPARQHPLQDPRRTRNAEPSNNSLNSLCHPMHT